MPSGAKTQHIAIALSPPTTRPYEPLALPRIGHMPDWWQKASILKPPTSGYQKALLPGWTPPTKQPHSPYHSHVTSHCFAISAATQHSLIVLSVACCWPHRCFFNLWATATAANPLRHRTRCSKSRLSDRSCETRGQKAKSVTGIAKIKVREQNQ